MANRELRIGLIGYNFMGKAHSQAWLNAGRYFELDAQPVLATVCGRRAEPLQAFADRWGWQQAATDWRQVVDDPQIDVIDIATPTALHEEIAIAALGAGKHVFCEKPFALNVAQAEAMLAAAEQSGKVHYLNHNYRRCPAVGLARQMIDNGKIGRIYHWRGAYLQSWILDENFPLTWQLQKDQAGAGPHWDLNSHSVDLARYLVGEIRSVSAMTANFITERPIPSADATAFSESETQDTQKGPVTVEDAAFMLVEFESGALGSFESSRFAAGRKNYNTFEIYGSEGALTFNLERMNELEYFDNNDPDHAHGFKTILVTQASHPYIAHWWPPGHMIGYEHEFTHAVVDFVNAVTQGTSITPNFRDGLACLKVLEAGLRSANSGKRVELDA